MSKEIQTVKNHEQNVNPFLGAKAEHLNAGTVEIESSRAVAEAQGKLLIAKKFPRNEAEAYAKIMQACGRKALAEQALYAYPKGGQTVSGVSIRFAEEVARLWGNIDYGIRELSQKDGISEMEAYCWDMQTNVSSSQRFTIAHERHTSKGVTKLTDPRDVYELTANMGARRLRARILAVLPADLVDAAEQAIKNTLAGNTSESIEDQIRKMLTAFAKFGVTKELIEKRAGKQITEFFPEDVVELRTIFTSIKDSMTKAGDWFGVKETAENTGLSILTATTNPTDTTK